MRNVYFPCLDAPNPLYEQAIRIAFRELWNQLGYRDKLGPEPAFYVLNEMSLMFIKGIELNSEYMVYLQKLAVIQTSMETMISRNTYDGVGLYKQWKAGKTLATHYTKPTCYHSSLYKDNRINPLKLDEPLWWCLMMSMLDLFEEQKNNYETALLAKGITTKQEFLNWLRTTYQDVVKGVIGLFSLQEQPQSVFTLEHFVPTDDIYYLKNHGIGHSQCTTKTYYSRHEIESYVSTSGCVWCKFVPSWSDFEPIENVNNQVEQLEKLVTNCSKLCVPIDSVTRETIDSEKTKILINMIGITGAGKSTVSKMISDYVSSNGGTCLIVSADKWSKKGVSGKNMKNAIKRELTEFNNSHSSKYKVIVVDICNENGPSTTYFGYDVSEYRAYNFYPNLDKDNFDDYQCWCLRNVLSRSKFSESTLYWLDPETAGVSTCIKVHNNKTKGLNKLLNIKSKLSFDESLSKDVIITHINTRAEEYATYLSTQSLNSIVKDFLVSCGFDF